MNKEIAFMLADALESGEYEQGAGRLKKDGKFCCLGVLCDLYRKHVKPEESWSPLEDGMEPETLYFADYGACLPPSVQEWAGMHSHVGTVRPEESEATLSLSYMNDTGKSFKYIANFIRENYERL